MSGKKDKFIVILVKLWVACLGNDDKLTGNER